LRPYLKKIHHKKGLVGEMAQTLYAHMNKEIKKKKRAGGVAQVVEHLL
jgi:hypothetical protein